MQRERERQRQRQTDRRTERGRERGRDRQTDRQTEKVSLFYRTLTNYGNKLHGIHRDSFHR